MAETKRKAGSPRPSGQLAAARQRLQKIMAAAGLGSRRACEQMIVDGAVEVNGKMVTKLPVLVDPSRDRIVVDGKELGRSRAGGIRTQGLVYYLLHKPKGVICTSREATDKRQVRPGGQRAIDLMVGVKQRVVCVGRLDVDSRGLLIMTNDGQLVNQLTHPRHEVPKTYRVKIAGYLSAEDIERLSKGIWMTRRRGEGQARSAEAAKVKIVHRDRTRTVLEVVLKEGRNRQIRRMVARLGYKVRDLVRIKIGPVSIKGLASGAYRRLTAAELARLKQVRGPARPARRAALAQSRPRLGIGPQSRPARP